MLDHERDQRMLQIVLELMERRQVTQAMLAEASGLKRSHVWKIVHGKCGISNASLSRLLAALNYPETAFHQRLQPPEGLRLAELRQLVEACSVTGARSAFAESIEERVRAWLVSDPGESPGSAFDLLIHHNENRHLGPNETRTALEALIDQNFARAPAAPLAADLAMALAIWAAIRRTEGFGADARAAYLAAFDLLPLTDKPFIEGFVVEKASGLLVDTGGAHEGLMLLERAQSAFSIGREWNWQARVFGDRGFYYFLLGKLDAAEYWLKLALEELPTEDAVHRFTALQVLSHLKMKLGSMNSAVCYLNEAESCCPAFPAPRAHLAWLKGRAHQGLGDWRTARVEFQTALKAILEVGEPLDVSLLTIDLAGTLLRLGDRDALRNLMSTTVSWYARLKRTHHVQQILEGIVLVARRGELSLAVLREARDELERAGREGTARIGRPYPVGKK